MQPRRLACLVLVAALAAGASGDDFPREPGVSLPERLEWSRRLDALAEDPPTALAAGPGGRVAVGGARGVRVLTPDGAVRTLLRRGPVTDLAWAPGGVLWVATTEAIYRIGPDGDTRAESLSQRDEQRRVVRLAADDGLVAAATDLGVHLRDADATWQRLPVLPSGAASLVALRRRGALLELWSVVDGELWIAARGGPRGDAWRLESREKLPLADPEARAAGDLLFDPPHARADTGAVLVLPDFLAVRSGAGAWQRLRPVLPPGARLSRICQAFGRLWLASDAGLLSADDLDGPWRRAAPPVGSLPVVGVVDGARLLAATHRGVYEARPAAPLPPTAAERPDVDHARVVARLHRAALREQGLRPASMRDLRRRVRLRGWWPELDVSFGYADYRDRRRDWDQAFVSGDTRYLHDRQRDRGEDYDVDVSLSWDLGDTAFHPEELDALRESRSLIALRDDVLDEVTALYFEREQVLARLAASPAADERLALELRAAELAAGLDAWTGGAFSTGGPDPVVSRSR